MTDNIELFENKEIRTAWDNEKEEWYFSIVDVIAVLTDSVDPTACWRKVKQRLKIEGNETVTNCHGLKMTAKDSKKKNDRCCRYRTAFTTDSVHSFKKCSAVK